jgi:hypothetical protein
MYAVQQQQQGRKLQQSEREGNGSALSCSHSLFPAPFSRGHHLPSPRSKSSHTAHYFLTILNAHSEGSDDARSTV